MKRNSCGQTLIETILVVPILLIIIFMIFWFSRVLLTRQQLQMAARYGTDLMVYTGMNEEEITKEIQDYLCTSEQGGRLLEKGKIKIRLHIERFPVIKPDNVMEVLTQFFAPLDHTSYAEVGYAIATPRIFSAWEGYLSYTRLDSSLLVSARSEVLAGTGYYENGHTKDIRDAGTRSVESTSSQSVEELPEPQNFDTPAVGEISALVGDQAQESAKNKVNEELDGAKQMFSVESAQKMASDLKDQAVKAVEQSAISSLFNW